MEVLWPFLIAHAILVGILAIASHLALRTNTKAGKWLEKYWAWFIVAFGICYIVLFAMMVGSVRR